MGVGRGQSLGLHAKYIIIVHAIKVAVTMNWIDLERHFSPARLGRYRVSFHGDQTRAESAYIDNMRLAEAMMPMLSVLEISLKNGIHHRLSLKYGRNDWWEALSGETRFAWQSRDIENASAKLLRRREANNPDKIIAELAFGFWSSLFNVQFQDLLWKDLRLVFPRCPKPERKRHTVSAALNQLRDLRNRVFHHEQLLWLTPSLGDQHDKGIQVLHWLDPQLPGWLASHDRLPSTWASIRSS